MVKSILKTKLMANTIVIESIFSLINCLIRPHIDGFGCFLLFVLKHLQLRSRNRIENIEQKTKQLVSRQKEIDENRKLLEKFSRITSAKR